MLMSCPCARGERRKEMSRGAEAVRGLFGDSEGSLLSHAGQVIKQLLQGKR